MVRVLNDGTAKKGPQYLRSSDGFSFSRPYLQVAESQGLPVASVSAGSMRGRGSASRVPQVKIKNKKL